MAKGAVKFFNAAKGFGFITPQTGGGDVFVHVSAVERAGLPGLNQGDQVEYELEADRRSGKMAAIDLRFLGAGPASPQTRPAAGGVARGSGSGVVKWFNSAKGFGFIRPNGGGGDIFVHISPVEQAGLRELDEGQAISYDIAEDRRSGKSSATNLRIDR